LHELLADGPDVLRECGREHHDLFTMLYSFSSLSLKEEQIYFHACPKHALQANLMLVSKS